MKKLVLTSILLLILALEYGTIFPMIQAQTNKPGQANTSSSQKVTFQLVGRCDFKGPGGQWFDIQGNYIYLTMLQTSLTIVDISDLNNPTGVYNFDCGPVFEIDVERDYAYLTSGNGGIVIVDIHELGNYRIVKRYNTSTQYTDVKIGANYMFLTAKKKGLEIVDISNPANPVEVSHVYETGTYSEDYMGYMHVAVKDNYVYLGHSENNLKIINISDIRNPSTVFTIPIISDNTEVYVVNNLLFLGIRRELRIYNITNPASPVLLSTMRDFSDPTHLTSNEGILFVYDDRLVAVDIRNPSSPQIKGIHQAFTHDLHYDGINLFSSETKFSIYKINRLN